MEGEDVKLARIRNTRNRQCGCVSAQHEPIENVERFRGPGKFKVYPFLISATQVQIVLALNILSRYTFDTPSFAFKQDKCNTHNVAHVNIQIASF